MIQELAILQQLDNETAIQLIDNAYSYLLAPKSVPLKKMSLQVRVPFSAIYKFLRTNPSKHIQTNCFDNALKTILSKEVILCLKEKVYLLYAQNYQKVGLLSNY